MVLTDDELDTDGAIDAEAGVFEGWIREGDPSRQVKLRSEVHHTDVRREATRAAAERSRGRDNQR